MRSLKAFLAILVVGAVLPGLLFGVATSWWLAREMRIAAEHEARGVVSQAAANVAEHIHLVTTAMKTLAQSPALTRDDLDEAYRYAALMAADLGHHIGLATADGQQLFNTRRPFGSPLPRRSEATSYRRALETGRPSISNVIIGAITKQPLVTIDIPVPSGKGARVLGTSTDPAALGEVLGRIQLKPGWKVSLVDGEGVFIARSLNPEVYVGRRAVPECVAAVKSDQMSGSFRNRSHEGDDLYSFFHKVPGTEWMVMVGIPETDFLAPLRGPLALLGAGGGMAMGLTVIVAVALSRRLEAAARRLTEDARAMGEGRELPPLSQTIAEFEQVETVLHEADRQSRAREAELALARDAAEQSIAAKIRFFAAANHDLRGPLNASGWCIELLREKISSPDLTRYLDGLQQTHNTMTSLIGDLFDIARMDSDGVAPLPATISLPKLVRAVFVECQPLAEEKGLTLKLRPVPEVEFVTDGEMLSRILRNLVHNAIRYTEHGGVMIACRLRGGGIWIDVWDSGIGIAADKLSLIWEEFYRIGSRNTGKGSGLGLSIVSRLVKLLGLHVVVRSRLGRGSVFRVVIPPPAE